MSITLTVGLLIAWRFAAAEANASGYEFIEKEHLLIGLCSLDKAAGLVDGRTVLDDDSVVRMIAEEGRAIADVLGSLGTDPVAVRRLVRAGLSRKSGGEHPRVMHRSPNCRRVFEVAVSRRAGQGRLSCLHLLAALAEDPGPVAQVVFRQVGVALAALRERALASAGGSHEAVFPVTTEAAPEGAGPAHPVAAKQPTPASPQPTPYLDRFGRDLTREAHLGKLGPVIGREREMLEVVRTLTRRRKSNPVLVGPPGVGKTAIVEGLAIRIAEHRSPSAVLGKRIIEIDLASVMAGTRYRGDLEERLTGIIAEVLAHPEVVVFIDEIHTLVGSGRGETGLDPASIFKPALARGGFRCIGATTPDEYRRYIESDGALERRFDRVLVREPSRDETIETLRGLRMRWQEHHSVRILETALEAAVDLSIRFDWDHQLPDKAIDLIDKAAARVRVPSLDPERQELPEVTERIVALVLAERTGIPVDVIAGQLENAGQARLFELEDFLKAEIVGQDHAVERVARRLFMAHAGLGRERGPIAVFLLLGPSGVGKTHLTRCLARFLFGDEKEMVRFDMSEFAEEHSVSKLIGSPPGYVGHEEGGQLTGKLRSRPYSVVLLDEAEKAHPRIWDVFLQVFDEGHITDAMGRTADARNAVFVMTSNITAQKSRSIGFRAGLPQTAEASSLPTAAESSATEKATLDELTRRFRPELLGRIDEVIVLHALGPKDVREILRHVLDETLARLRRRFDLQLDVTPEALDILAREGYSPVYGARELRRTVETRVEIPLSRLLLEGKARSHGRWQLAATDEGGVALTPIPPDAVGAD
jgi:ATP-dependent Clp protease ATP-binding subunit ClpC